MTQASRVALRTGVTLSCAVRGPTTGVPLVLLPGPTDSWWSHEPVMPYVDRSVRVIAVSPRGHGDSDKPPSGYSVQELGADAIALLDALDIEQAVFVGHSGSCLVARWAAIRRPERVAGLVLEASPSSLLGHPQLENLVTTVLTDLRDPVDREFVRSFIADTSSDALEPDVVDVLVSEAQKVPAHVWRALFGALLRYDDTIELDQVRAPTLLIWGDADPIVTRTMQDALLERIPAAELLVYEGCAHTPRWEAPSRFASDITGFVGRC